MTCSCVFFFKQKTAYEMRISDWSSDVCSSDLTSLGFALFFHNFSTWTGRRGLYLEDLYVTPEARGVGVGAALLRHLAGVALDRGCGRFEWAVLDRSEEHTSELQSLMRISYAVFCLKKKTHYNHTQYYTAILTNLPTLLSHLSQ